MASWRDKLAQATLTDTTINLAGFPAVVYACTQLRKEYSSVTPNDEYVWTINAQSLCDKFNAAVTMQSPAVLHKHAHKHIFNTSKSVCLTNSFCFIKITVHANTFIHRIDASVHELLVPHVVSACGHVQVLDLCKEDGFSLREKCDLDQIKRAAKFIINAMQVLFAVDLMYTDIKLENIGISNEQKYCLLDLESIMPYTHPTQPCSATFVPDKRWVFIPHLQKLLPFYGAGCTFIDLANATYVQDKIDPVNDKHRLVRCVKRAIASSTGDAQCLYTVALAFLQHASAMSNIHAANKTCTEAMHCLYNAAV